MARKRRACVSGRREATSGLIDELLEIDVGHLQLTGQRRGDLILGDEALLDEYAAELAPALALIVQGFLQLLPR